MLLLVYLLAGVAVFAGCFRLRESFADRFFPIFLVSVALSLLLSGSLISKYIPFGDIREEFTIFQQVASLGVWNPAQNSSQYNGTLSVTILPTIISLVSSIGGTIMFKTVYPSLFAFVPLLLYKIYRKIMSPTASFISVFVFLFYPSSYLEIADVARQMIGELILILLLWIPLCTRLRKTHAGDFLVVLLTIGLVASHYSLAMIYVALIGFSYLWSRISPKSSEAAEFGTANRLALSLVVSAGWFLFTAGGIIFQNFSTDFLSIVNGILTDFFNPTSRPVILYQAIGISNVNFGILHLANRAIQYLIVLCIIVGFVAYLRKKRTNSIEEAMIPLMMVCMALLLAAVALPNFAGTLNINRIYSLSLLLLAPCFYFGAGAITSGFERICALINRHPPRVNLRGALLCAILFSYLIFTSGWVWAITLDTPTSLVLDSARIANSPNALDRTFYYATNVLQEDVQGTRWITSHGSAQVCADYDSEKTIVTYGGSQTMGPIFRFSWACDGAYVYVSVMNVRTEYGTGPGASAGPSLSAHPSYIILSVNYTIPRVMAEDRIYSNGAAIYAPP
jgi:uncharacterized membrane protein